MEVDKTEKMNEQKPMFTVNEANQDTIDLFRLYILFSQYRSCDDTQEI